MNKRLKMRLALPVSILTYIIFMAFMVKTLHKVPLGCMQDTHIEVRQCGNNRPPDISTDINISDTRNVRVVHRNISPAPRSQLYYPGQGPGEGGNKVNTARIDTSSRDDIDTQYGFNTLISDMISIHRKLKDTRPPACQFIDYPSDLPMVSVVILFRDEWPSAVLRTAYSVLETSNPDILKEILLVDDCSTNAELISLVDFHVDNVDKFKLIRNHVPLGLMKARDIGIKATTTDYFIVMDGHMEVSPGWLEPLLDRLVQQPKSLLTPNIGTINLDNFETKFGQTDGQFMYFDILSMAYGWADYRKEFLASRLNDLDPIPYAIYPGMVTVMRKDFYLKLGGFDTGMETWGSEEIELSIKVWLCGGRVEMVPCSRAAHMYRPSPWKNSQYFEQQTRNKARLTEVWIDQPYRQFTFEAMKNMSYPTGDISDRLHLRRTNKCKPFKFYVNTIRAFSQLYIPEKPKDSGVLYNAFYQRCLQFDPQTYHLSLHSCHGNISQYFILTEHWEIRASEGRVLRLNAFGKTKELALVVSPIIVRDPSALWQFRDDSTIMNVGSGLCLTALTMEQIGVTPCNNDILNIWFWKLLTEL